MILITGAGGKTGRTLTRVLSKVERVCALVHHQKQIAILQSLGAEKVILGDMRDEAIIHSEMPGVQSVYHICPNMHPDEIGIGKLVVAAARQNGVEHFVYHSVLHPQVERMNHHWQKMRVEEMLFESGIPYTILQPAPYLQNLLAGWKSILEDGILRIPYSVDSKFSFVDLEDVAEAVKVVLTQGNHTNATYELSGTMPMSYVEVAEILSRDLNRTVRAEKEDIESWKLRAAGMNDYATENLVSMFEYYDQWGLTGNPNVLRWLLDREPTSLNAFIERMVKQDDAH